MAPIDQHLPPCCSVPYLHRTIVACGGDACSIGRPGHRLHSIPMAMIGNDTEAVRGVPYAHRLIIACGSNVCTPGRPCYSRDAARMTATDIAGRSLWLWLWRT